MGEITGKNTDLRRRLLYNFFRALLILIEISLLWFGLALLFFISTIIEGKVREAKRLVPGTDLYRIWKKPNYSISTEIFVYSVLNPDGVVDGERPKMSTIGPYYYKISEWRKILELKNGTIRYQTVNKFDLDTNRSCADCLNSRKIFIPNMVFEKFVEVASNPETAAAQFSLASQKPFIEVTVDKALFSGYKDPYLENVCALPLMDFICEAILELPEKISFLSHRNGTSGTFVVSTGEFDNGESTGSIITWNGNNQLPADWWSSEEARKIKGSEGNVFKAYINKTISMDVFVEDLCRTITLTFDTEFDYTGIPAYRFSTKEDLLDPKVGYNKGFCHNSNKKFFSDDEKCLPRGLLDISRCHKGNPPIVFSFPHFLFADKDVQDSIFGLDAPNITHDNTVIEVEPRTGTVIRVYRRSQINVAMWRGQNISPESNFSRMRSSIIPIFADYQTAEIDSDTLELLRNSLIKKECLLRIISFTMIAVGAILLLGTIAVIIIRKSKAVKSLFNGWLQKSNVKTSSSNSVNDAL